MFLVYKRENALECICNYTLTRSCFLLKYIKVYILITWKCSLHSGA